MTANAELAAVHTITDMTTQSTTHPDDPFAAAARALLASDAGGPPATCADCGDVLTRMWDDVVLTVSGIVDAETVAAVLDAARDCATACGVGGGVIVGFDPDSGRIAVSFALNDDDGPCIRCLRSEARSVEDQLLATVAWQFESTELRRGFADDVTRASLLNAGIENALIASIPTSLLN